MYQSLTVSGKDCAVKHLRPQPGTTTLHEEESKAVTKQFGMRMVDVDILNKLLADFCQTTAHTNDHTAIPQIKQIAKKGVTIRATVGCLQCDVETPFQNIYAPVQGSQRGPKAAAANRQLAVAVQNSTLGAKGAAQLLSTIGMTTPSMSALQSSLCYASKEAEKINRNDMKERIKKHVQENRDIKQMNTGIKSLQSQTIGLSVDTRYNTTRFGDSRKNVGQSATQAVTTAINVQTGDIVQYAVQNKLCHKGSMLRAQGGENLVCGSSSEHCHEGCTATLIYGDNLSEIYMNKEIAERCVINGALPTTVVSDNDGKGVEAYDALLCHLDGERGVEVHSQSDPSHIAGSQLRAAVKADFSNGMFGVTAKIQRMRYQQVLARDLIHRSSTMARILQNGMKEHCWDQQTLTHKVNEAVKTAVKCFTNNHSMCRIVDTGCRGTERQNWMERHSGIYHVCKLKQLDCTDSDCRLLSELFKIRLHSSVIHSTKLGYSTQANEAFNRRLSKNVPKNTNWSRNVKGRVAAACHQHNNSYANSVILTLRSCGAALPKGSEAVKQLSRIQRHADYINKYRSQRSQRFRRAVARRRRMIAWWRTKSKSRVWGLGFGVWGLGFGVWGLGFGVWGLGFGVWGLGFGVWGFGVWGLGFGVWGLGFGVWGLGLWAWGLGLGFGLGVWGHVLLDHKIQSW